MRGTPCTYSARDFVVEFLELRERAELEQPEHIANGVDNLEDGDVRVRELLSKRAQHQSRGSW